MTMPARVADRAKATTTRDGDFIARIVNLSAAALQTGKALGGVDKFDEGGFVRSERFADWCGREPPGQSGPPLIIGRPNPLGGIADAVAEQQSELRDRGGEWQMPHASTGTNRFLDQRACLAFGLLVARPDRQPVATVVPRARSARRHSHWLLRLILQLVNDGPTFDSAIVSEVDAAGNHFVQHCHGVTRAHFAAVLTVVIEVARGHQSVLVAN